MRHRRFRLDLDDALIVLGIAFVAVGMWLLAPWLAFAVVGTIVMVLGFVVAVIGMRAELRADLARRGQQG